MTSIARQDLNTKRKKKNDNKTLTSTYTAAPDDSNFIAVILNARSVCPKIEDLGNQFHDGKTSLMLLSETWEKPSSADDIENFEQKYGVTWHSKKRDDGYGGVAIAISNDFATGRVLNIDTGNLELIWCLLQMHSDPTRPLIVCSVYACPTQGRKPPPNAIQRHIADTYAQLSIQYPNSLFLCGGDVNHEKVTDIINMPKMKQIVTVPSRKGAFLIKGVSNIACKKCEGLPPLCPTGQDGQPSDHDVIKLHLTIQPPEKRPWLYRTYRKITDVAINSFGEEFRAVSWKSIFHPMHNVDQLVDEYDKVVDGLVSKHFPFVTQKIRRGNALYFNDKLRRMHKKAQRAYNKGGGRCLKYKRHKKNFRRSLKRAQEDYHKKILENTMRNNIGVYHRKIKELVKNGGRYEPKYLPDVEEMCGVKSLKEKADIVAHDLFKLTENYNPINLEAERERYKNNQAYPRITFEEVVENIKKMKYPNGTHRNDPPQVLFKKFPELFAWPLLKIINTLYRTETWPSKWKEEETIMIPKKNQLLN